MEGDRVLLAGSRPSRPPGLTAEGPASPGDRLEVSILLRRSTDPGDLEGPRAGPPSSERETIPPVRLEASRADVEGVETFLREMGLDLLEADPGRRTVRVAGTVSAMERAFGVTLHRARFGNVSFLTYDEPITLPRRLSGVVVGVLGLDQRPVARR